MGSRAWLWPIVMYYVRTYVCVGSRQPAILLQLSFFLSFFLSPARIQRGKQKCEKKEERRNEYMYIVVVPNFVCAVVAAAAVVVVAGFVWATAFNRFSAL